MSLPEIFGLSTFPVFRPYRYFDGQNKSSKITLTYRKCYRKTKIHRKCWKCQKYTGIIGICQKWSKILKIDCLRRKDIRHLIRNVLYDLASSFCHIHSKNAFKTVLACSGAEINSCLGFGHFLIYGPFLITYVCILTGIFGKHFRNFRLFPKPSDFRLPVENVPNCLNFYFGKVGIISQNYTEVRNPYRNAWPYLSCYRVNLH